MNAIVYYKTETSEIKRIINLLESNGVFYTQAKIGVDMMLEDFQALFPNAGSVLVSIDNNKFGSYNEVFGYIQGRPSFLAETA